MIHPLIIGLLIIGIIALMVVGGALARHWRSSLHRWTAAFLFFAVAWSVIVNLQDPSQSSAYNLMIIQLTFISAIMMLYAMVRFALSVTSGRAVWWVPAVSIISAALIAATAIGFVVSSVTIENGAIMPTREPLYFVVIALLLGLAGLSVAILVAVYRRARHVQYKRQLGVVTSGVTLGVVAGALTNIVLPNVTHTIEPARYAWIALLLWTCALVYAVARHRFLDIRAVVVRTVVYTLVIATFVVLYYLLVVVILLLLSGYSFSTMTAIALNAGVAVLLAFVFQPLKHFFDTITNSIFYRGRYSRNEFYARLSATLAQTASLMSLLRRSATVISSTLGASQVFFVLRQGEKIVTGGTTHHSRIARQDIDWLQRVWTSEYQEVPLFYQGRADRISETDGDMTRVLRTYDIAILVPLRKNQEVLGFLCLGEHNGGRYAERDLAVLEAVADELVIAIQNALSLREVQLLNETLQQRIDGATSELRASNAQLRKLDEAKDEFISMASHQLRTPLTSIKGYLDMMLEGDAGKISPLQRQFLTEAYVSSERMVHLINDFLNVSRLQTGRFMVERRPTDLVSVIKQEIDSLGITAEGRKLSFKLTMPKKLPLLLLDEAKMRQVIMNFADNALYYSRPGTVVRVKLMLEDGWLLFTVKDTGIGVPAAEQKQLFTKFYRASNARRQRPDGTGVGLFLAKRVITEHGGEVVFTSEEGKGSTFGFRLPEHILLARHNTDELNKQPNDDPDN